MNVSMQDAFNLGWKLAAVLRGQSPERILHSYSAERQSIAKELIEFDREWAAMLTAPLKSATCPDGAEPEEIQSFFSQHGRYTAGTATRYSPSLLIEPSPHQHLASGFELGTRFHSAPVIRVADAKPMHLGHALEADGRWRLIIFAARHEGRFQHGSSARKLIDFLAGSERSPIRRFGNVDADVDFLIDVRVVIQDHHRDIDLNLLPGLVFPEKGPLRLRDYEKIFCSNRTPGCDIFDLRQVDRDRGCMVVVRPDQYVANILPIDAHDDLSDFFGGFMTDRPHTPSA
jgi:phenol 2-monooxygenase